MEKFLDLTIRTDMYNGLTIDLHNCNESKLEDCLFEKILQEKLKIWIEKGRRCIWFIIPAEFSYLITILIKNGFEFHHAKPNFVMLVKWIQNSVKRIPKYAHTVVGVGGLVYDPKLKKVLLIQEKTSRVKMWKFPGGYSEPGENIGDTAIREVKEETGIECQLESIITFRHNHRAIFNCSDFYFVCLLIPINNTNDDDDNNNKIEYCQIEIDDCRWFSLQEARQNLCGFNHYVFEEFLKQYSLDDINNDNNLIGMTIKTEIIHSQYGPYKRDEQVYSIRKN